MNWAATSVVVTGGAGFLGSFVVDRLRSLGCQKVFVPRSRDFDLRSKEATRRLLEQCGPDLVIHLAATVGGIGANRANPARFFYDNAIMGLELLEQARLAHVRKVIIVGSVCGYPKETPTPFREESIWDGYPEETNAPYGLAKRMLLVQAQAYRQQYGLNTIYLVPTNLYGPGDNFDPDTSHVIPALIRKCIEARDAGRSSVTAWGDGTATRDFLFVEDAADAILLAAAKYNDSMPINVGSGQEVSIGDLASLVASATRFQGHIIWDASKPNGQRRRCLDCSKANLHFGFVANTQLATGLDHTVRWFENQRIA